jgi:hypothetical protein
MARTVFILGAGASKKAGAPLMGDFLDIARDLWRGRHATNEAFGKVFRGISRLQQVHSKASLDIHNVESVFAAFEMSKTLGRFGEYDLAQIDELVASMREVIVQTLDETIRIPWSGNQPRAPEPYPEFVRLVSDLNRASRPERTVAIITFNYDVALDFACFQNGTHVDYALDSRKQSGNLPLLKLHGSLNWATCDKCNSLVAWDLSKYLGRFQWLHVDSETRFVSMPIGAQIKEFTHCDEKVSEAPVIVPPTWNKTEFHRALSSVWGAAARELSDAEDLFIIGYSLPESDAFFRYLFALGTIGDTLLRRVWVFNPDNSPELQGRFRILFGPGAEQRFRFFPINFDGAIGHLREEFQSTFRR